MSYLCNFLMMILPSFCWFVQVTPGNLPLQQFHHYARQSIRKASYLTPEPSYPPRRGYTAFALLQPPQPCWPPIGFAHQHPHSPPYIRRWSLKVESGTKACKIAEPRVAKIECADPLLSSSPDRPHPPNHSPYTCSATRLSTAHAWEVHCHASSETENLLPGKKNYMYLHGGDFLPNSPTAPLPIVAERKAERLGTRVTACTGSFRHTNALGSNLQAYRCQFRSIYVWILSEL